MAVSLSPLFNPDSAQIDANGAPRSGALLFTYLAGTSTKATTYKTSSGSGGASHTNPIVLDANGLPPAPIWLTQNSTYKFVLAPSTDADPPVSAILSVDNISGVNDVADVVGNEWISSGMTPTYISATSFSVPTDQTSTLDVNRRLKFTVTAGTRYGYIIKSTFTSLTTVTVLLDSGSLDSGLSAFSYGIVSAANTSLPFFSRDQQCGRLIYVSATSIRLDPHDGNTIWVYTAAAGWARRAIPSAGISATWNNLYKEGVSGQTLSAAGVTYWVYLFDNAGTLTLDFSTTAPAVDATSGLYIKTGVATRLLIGMVRPNGSSQFQANGIGVLSWYQRRAIAVSAAFTTARTTTSTSAVEINSEIRTAFLSWAEEAVVVTYSGYATNSTTGSSYTTYITLDGAVTSIMGQINVNAPVASYADNISVGCSATVTEGYHYVTIAGQVSANTGTWQPGNLYVTTRG